MGLQPLMAVAYQDVQLPVHVGLDVLYVCMVSCMPVRFHLPGQSCLCRQSLHACMV